MSKRYREVLEEVETPASRRAADRDAAAVADEPRKSTIAATVDRPDEAGTGMATPDHDPGTGGGVATLVRPTPTTSQVQRPNAAKPPPEQARVRRTRPGNGPADADEPLAFTWRGRHYAVTRILGHWREEEGWWRRPDGEPIRIEQSDLWRVEAVRGAGVVLAPDLPGAGRGDPQGNGRGVYELARRGATWRLDRVWD